MRLHNPIRVQMFLIAAVVTSPCCYAQNHEDEGPVPVSSKPLIQALNIMPFDNAFFYHHVFLGEYGLGCETRSVLG